MYFSCLILGFLLFNLVFVLCLKILSSQEFWHMIRNHIRLVFTTIVYYCLTLLVIPLIHGAVVAKEHRLVRPRVQSALIFVWEIFYSVQMAVPVCLHLLCAFRMTIVMLFRPDQFLMRAGWDYLDMMFFVYPSIQYEQIMTAARKYTHDRLGDQTPNYDDNSYSLLPICLEDTQAR